MAAERDEEESGLIVSSPAKVVTRDAHGRLLPGSVNNPSGRANDAVKYLRDVLKRVTPDDVWGVFKALHERALDGDVRAAELYLSYILGKPVQRNEFSGTDGVPFVLTVVPRLDPPPTTTVIDPDDEH
jgi:hypothetical protein